MSYVDRRRAVPSVSSSCSTVHRRPRRRLQPRVALAAGCASVVLCGGQILGLAAGPLAGGSPPHAPLAVALSFYDGDSVTTTPSESAPAGTDVTSQITVSNTGSAPQTNVSVPITLPANFSLHNGSLTPSAGTTAVAAGVVTWTIASLAPGGSETLAYTETTDAPAAFESNATAATATSDQDATGSTTSASVVVIPAANLTIGVSDGTDSITPGSIDSYTITLTNDGPSEAPNATVSTTFTDGFTPFSAVSSVGGTSFDDLGAGQFSWTGIDLPSGASAEFELVGAMSTASRQEARSWASRASACTPVRSTPTPCPPPRTPTWSPAARRMRPLAVALSFYDGDSVTTTPSESAPAGTDVTSQITVSNTGSAPQTNVSVPITLPANFSLHNGSLTPSAGTTAVAAGVVTWTIASLAPGGSETLAYTETTDAPAAFESNATAATATSDQDATGSTTSASVVVIPAANLTIGVSDGTDSITPGSIDSYTITLTNDGPSEAPNATVSTTFTDGFTPFSAVSSVGGTSFDDLGAGQFSWTGIDLPSGASAEFELVGAMSSGLTAGSAFVGLVNGAVSPDQIGSGTASNAVDSDTVIGAPQAITFTPPSMGVAGQSTTLSATGGGSGKPVVFSVDPSSDAGACSVSGPNGTILSYLQAGTCVIDADEAGNASYAAAPTVTASIVVDQKPTFTLDSPPTSGTVGQGYAYTFAATGAPAPTYSLTRARRRGWVSIQRQARSRAPRQRVRRRSPTRSPRPTRSGTPPPARSP